jgi:hypothetical protein
VDMRCAHTCAVILEKNRSTAHFQVIPPSSPSVKLLIDTC